MVSNNCFSPYFACVSFPFIERKPKVHYLYLTVPWSLVNDITIVAVLYTTKCWACKKKLSLTTNLVTNVFFYSSFVRDSSL